MLFYKIKVKNSIGIFTHWHQCQKLNIKSFLEENYQYGHVQSYTIDTTLISKKEYCNQTGLMIN